MTAVDWSRVQEIFADARELPPEDRAALVAERCQGNGELEAAVLRLLAADVSADADFLDAPDPTWMAAVTREAFEALPERVGPWRLLEEIGRGGMGRVVLAERADGQFEQRVAVKLLKRGMDSDAILARFLRERQILAELEHPNIARLLDGGVAEDGRPYFVLELVDGLPITCYADEARLDVDARVTLFRTVCEAVRYAHRKLIVHRDLKPSNILVTRDGHPKLLDFGIAKLLVGDEGDHDTPTLTVGDARLMTPAYAAPEQIRGDPVTTSTDVYGLGAVLYELLSGHPPFPARRDRLELPPDAEPAPLAATAAQAPSPTAATPGSPHGRADRGADEGARSSAPTPDPAAVAADRSTDPVRLRRQLSGDLETIVAVALRADPERRYPTVDGLADDLRRHQERLPVRARPDTVGYRVSRFVARNRMAVAGTASLVLLALAFGVTATFQARALEAERDRAQREAAAARAVSDFMVGVFETADPMRPGAGDTVRASDLLDRGALRVQDELGDEPELASRLLRVIGLAYENLGWTERAEPLVSRAVEIEREAEVVDSAELAGALHRLGMLRANRNEFAAALVAFEEAVAIRERIDPDPGTFWPLLVDLAYAHHGVGDGAAGSATLARALDQFEAAEYRGSDEERAARSRMISMMGSPAEAERHEAVFRRIAEVERAEAGPASARYAALLNSWARNRAYRGDDEGADSLGRRAVEIQRAIDPTSMPLANYLIERTTTLLALGRQEEALAAAQEATDVTVAVLGEHSREANYARAMLPLSLAALSRHEEAIAIQERVIQGYRTSQVDAYLVGPALRRMALLLWRAGRPAEAVPFFREGLRELDAQFPPGYVLTAQVHGELGAMLVEVERGAEAEDELRAALEVLAEHWGEDDERVRAIQANLDTALELQERGPS